MSGDKAKVNGSISNQRVVAAGMRAIEAHARVRRVAERFTDELDEVTPVHGVPMTDLDPEDSLVTSIEEVMKTASAQGK